MVAEHPGQENGWMEEWMGGGIDGWVEVYSRTVEGENNWQFNFSTFLWEKYCSAVRVAVFPNSVKGVDLIKTRVLADQKDWELKASWLPGWIMEKIQNESAVSISQSASVTSLHNEGTVEWDSHMMGSGPSSFRYLGKIEFFLYLIVSLHRKWCHCWTSLEDGEKRLQVI